MIRTASVRERANAHTFPEILYTDFLPLMKTEPLPFNSVDGMERRLSGTEAPMDLAERLDALQLKKRQKELILEAVRAGQVAGVQSASQHFERAESVSETPAGRLLDALAHGRVVDRDGAHVLLFESRLELEREARAAQAYRIPMAHESALERHEILSDLYPELKQLERIDVSRIAFFDTETTGLAGGSGTVPFLAGIGWFERDGDGTLSRFIVEQYLIDDFCHETLQLKLLHERLEGFDAYCTYNGRAFDLPLMRARSIINRMKPSIWRKPHLDLLPFSRRLWKGAFESVGLRSVERNVFGIEREQDVDGALIPQIWTHYARTGHCGHMPFVVHHNAQDIVTLACLLAYHVRAIESPDELRRASECRGIARWFEHAGQIPRACNLYERALSLTNDDEQELKLLYHLARLYRRQNDWVRATEIWRGIKERPLTVGLPAWVELAKYLEHRERDLSAARMLIHQCLRQLEIEEELRLIMGKTPNGLAQSTVAEKLRRRLQRIETRISRRSSSP